MGGENDVTTGYEPSKMIKNCKMYLATRMDIQNTLKLNWVELKNGCGNMTIFYKVRP